MGSTRLQGKVLKTIADKTVLGHDIARLKKVKNADLIIIATSKEEADKVIIEECQKYEVECYRGSDSDVLERFYEAAKQYELTDIVRICSDNPLLDWEIIDKEIDLYLTGQYDIVKSGNNIPLGFGGEIFSYASLKEAYDNADKEYQHEHVTPYIYEHSEKAGLYNIEQDYSKYRFTLDTPADWKLVNALYEKLYHGKHDFCLDDVIEVMETNEELFKLNAHIKQKQVK